MSTVFGVSFLLSPWQQRATISVSTGPCCQQKNLWNFRFPINEKVWRPHPAKMATSSAHVEFLIICCSSLYSRNASSCRERHRKEADEAEVSRRVAVRTEKCTEEPRDKQVVLLRRRFFFPIVSKSAEGVQRRVSRDDGCCKFTEVLKREPKFQTKHRVMRESPAEPGLCSGWHLNWLLPISLSF